jgi:hypothetical protein
VVEDGMKTIPRQQPGLFDYESRLKKLDRGPDPLARLNAPDRLEDISEGSGTRR